MSEGEPRRGELVWRLAEDGSQHPDLESEAGLQPLGVPVGRYAEPATGAIGPLSLGVPPRLLQAVLSAPSVPAEAVPRLRQELERRLPGSALPLPRALEAPVVTRDRPDSASSPAHRRHPCRSPRASRRLHQRRAVPRPARPARVPLWPRAGLGFRGAEHVLPGRPAARRFTRCAEGGRGSRRAARSRFPATSAL